jgi:hypothetical protein
MESETEEVRNAKKYMYRLLEEHSNSVQMAQEVVDNKGEEFLSSCLSSNVSKNGQVEADRGAEAVLLLKASVVTELHKEVKALRPEGNYMGLGRFTV